MKIKLKRVVNKTLKNLEEGGDLDFNEIARVFKKHDLEYVFPMFMKQVLFGLERLRQGKGVVKYIYDDTCEQNVFKKMSLNRDVESIRKEKDDSLIAGCDVNLGDIRLDASLKGQLERFEKHLKA